MTNISYENNGSLYNLGMNSGFFAAFLFFCSAFYFIMNFLNKIPKAIKYYHVLSFVVVIYLAGFLILKFRK